MTNLRQRTQGSKSNQANLVLGIDLGTTGAKALVIDALNGVKVARGYCGYGSVTSAEGVHEQDPSAWWSASVSAVRQALASGVEPSTVRAVGLSGHMHALVLVDEWDNCLRPAMTWADRRSAPQVRRLQRYAPLFTERCANRMVEAFTAPKVAWVAEHEPEILARAVRLVQPKDVLRHRLTATWGTDVTDACGTLLYDVHADQWDAELWRVCGASIDLAPPVSASDDVIGVVTGDAAAETGLRPGTPVVAGASDVACAALGAGLVRPGMIYVNAGTAAQILAPVQHSADDNHFLFRAAMSDNFLAMGSVYAAGLSVQWVADQMLPGKRLQGSEAGARINRLALQAPAGASGMVYIPHLLGTSAPTHDPLVRGALVGIAANHCQSTIARAVVEGVAYACAAAVDQLKTAAGAASSRIRVGGGMTRSTVFCEAMAAVHDVPLERIDDESSSVGAAILAGVGVDLWSDPIVACNMCVTATDLPVPELDVTRRYRAARERYEAAAEALTLLAHNPAFEEAPMEGKHIQ